jgi:hypothetical protein
MPVQVGTKTSYQDIPGYTGIYEIVWSCPGGQDSRCGLSGTQPEAGTGTVTATVLVHTVTECARSCDFKFVTSARPPAHPARPGAAAPPGGAGPGPVAGHPARRGDNARAGGRGRAESESLGH